MDSDSSAESDYNVVPSTSRSVSPPAKTRKIASVASASSTSRGKAKSYAQRFRKDWMENRPWLKPAKKGSTYFFL